MKLLNLGCGGKRKSGEEWTHLDDLHSQLPEGSPARNVLDSEKNYLNHIVVPDSPLPFLDHAFSGVLAEHFFEHWDCQDALKIMRECHRILQPNGLLMVSVPDATYFRHVYAQDKGPYSWPDLYGVTDPPNPIPTFFEAALWFYPQHKAILTEDSLWAYFVRSGFINVEWAPKPPVFDDPVRKEMASLLDRIPFSLVMVGVKS